MKNKFCLLSCRFHVKNKDKLLIQGYFEENELQGNRPIISLDYTALEYETEARTFIRNPLDCMGSKRGNKRYFFLVDLPPDYEKYKELRCFQFHGTEVQEVFHLSVKWIKTLKKKEEFYIDEAVYGIGGFRIKGWCVCEADPHMYLSDRPDGSTKLPFHVRRVSRPDARHACPDCREEDIYGFHITGDRVGKKLWCVMEDSKGIRIHKIQIRAEGRARQRITRKELFRKVQVYYQQFGFRKTVLRCWEKLTKRETTTYRAWRWKHCPPKKELRRQRQTVFSYQPSYAIVVPLYKTPKKYLDNMIQSIRKQTYRNWVLYLSDGSGADSPLEGLLKRYEKEDERIVVIRNEQTLRIVENTNAALEKTKEDFIVFMDHDDTIAPETLYECTKVLNESPDTDILYTDEDKLTINGKEFFQPYLKSDFNLDLLRCGNYMCHLFVARRTLVEEVGYLKKEYEGSQDYDLILRCVEKTDRIVHIPKILYHWRAHMDSTAGNPDSKEYAYVAGKKAIEEHYHRVGLSAEVERLSHGFYRTRYHLTDTPLISIIIPNKDHIEDLDRCISSIEEKSKYRNLEYLVIENNSEEKDTFSYYAQLERKYKNVRILYWTLPFNYSAINNFAVTYAKGEYLLFLNNDTEVIYEDCIEELLTFCMRKEIGIVGARLLYPDEIIQHAGVIVGLGGIAGHAFLGLSGDDPGYFCRVLCAQQYSAVTAACMMVKREAFEKVGGMDEAFEVAFNDVDFCMRVQKEGYQVVYNPFAVLYHYESKTRGMDDTEEKALRFQREVSLFANRWQEFLQKGDPYYNPNLTLARHDFSLKV